MSLNPSAGSPDQDGAAVGQGAAISSTEADASGRGALLSRYRRGLSVGLGLGVLTYAALSLRAEFSRVFEHLLTFQWLFLVPVLLLSLTNFCLRMVRWEFYLRRLQIRIPLKTSISIFLAGLSMTITPGKAGELLKSLLLKDVSQTPVMRSASVILAERATDFIALVLLASVGISTYYPDQQKWLGLVGAGLLGGVLVLNSEGLSLGSLRLMARIPGLAGVSQRLEELWRAAQTLFKLQNLLTGIALGTAAWLAECVGYYVVFNGHGVSASFGVCVFLYAFSTIVGVVSPGGLVITDASLGEGARLLIPGMEASLATAAAFVIRLCTLWFAVLIGSITLMRFSAPTRSSGPLHAPTDSTPSP